LLGKRLDDAGSTTEVRNGLGISEMVDTIAQAFRACGRRADAR
jgi:hypothetical protein